MNEKELKDLVRELVKEIKEAIKEELAQYLYPRWLSTKDAIRYSGLSKDSLYRLYKEGEIYATSIGGGKLIWDRNSIDDYFLRRKNEIVLKTREILSKSRENFSKSQKKRVSKA